MNHLEKDYSEFFTLTGDNIQSLGKKMRKDPVRLINKLCKTLVEEELTEDGIEDCGMELRDILTREKYSFVQLIHTAFGPFDKDTCKLFWTDMQYLAKVAIEQDCPNCGCEREYFEDVEDGKVVGVHRCNYCGEDEHGEPVERDYGLYGPHY